MLKSLIIIGHLIGIFFLSFLFSDEITITDTFPESLNVGENYTVTTSITKNDVTGFAKYQIEAPKGIVIKPIDLNGASFTFKDGKAKFIWMNLPTEPSFDIQYELTLENGELGSQKEVNSRFSYLVANERKIHEGPNHVLNVAGDEAVSTNVQSSGSSEISASRKITAEGDNKFLVEIDISKLGVKGFAKIQDAIPDGFVATEVMNSEAIFTQTESKVKLVWFDIPKNMNLQVSYLLEAPADFTGKASISGKFHYMAGSDLKKVDVPGQAITIGAEMVADNSTSDEETNNASNNNAGSDETAINSSNTDAQDVNTAVNENINKADESISESANNTADVVTNTAQEVDESITQKTDEVAAINDVVENETNDATSSDNSSTETNEETTSFMDSFVTGQSTKSDGTVDGQDESKSTDTASNDVNNTITNSQSSANSTNTANNNDSNEEIEDKSNNDVIIPTTNNTASNINNSTNTTTSSNEVVNNTSSSNTATNNTVTNNTNASNTNLTPTQTSDMTANVAEPESTAVATKEYVKDEVIAEEKNFSNLTNVTAADKGINYRVQIMAGKNVVGKEYLRKKHSYYSEFIIENHQGWIKYTSGDYGTYKVARDQRNLIRDQYNFNGPFVSAYNDGVRITVQEALMITKQQWYN